jgi:predicted Kef-type K+ transport protein
MTVTVWLSFAFILGLIVRLIGLPPLVGFLAAGFVLSALGYTTDPLLSEIAHAGVLLLLFSVGLKLRLKSLLSIEVLASSLLHLVITTTLFVILFSQVTHLEMQTAVLVAIALSFSSTVIAAKILESKKELRAFHGRVAIGILIVQDIVAVALLSVTGSNTPSPWAIVLIGLSPTSQIVGP